MDNSLIKRSDVINAIERTGLSEDGKDTAIRVVENLPSAERKGKWIREPFVTDYPYKCPVCKKYSRARYDFCPNCGAYMLPDDDSIYG